MAQDLMGLGRFFDFIRFGVRASVMQGLADAVETMGTPPNEESKEKVLNFLRDESQVSATQKRVAAGPTAASGGRRSLGRSMTEIQAIKSE